MRIVLLFATLFVGIQFGANAIATVNQYQEKQAEAFCQVDPNHCK